MLPRQLFRIGGSHLTIETLRVEPCAVALLRGAADDTASDTIVEAGERLVAAPQPRLVLDLQHLEDATAWGAGTVARVIREAHRVGKEVYLVRCPGWFYHQLESSGLGGPVVHAGSLSAATECQLGDAASTLNVCLRSAPENLRRVRSVLNVLAMRLTFSEDELQQIKTAIGEACTNAITHGSPFGPRNHIQVSFHLNGDALIVDVADEGPGFNPESVPAPQLDEMPEHGFGIFLMRRLMDRLEYFRDPTGTVVRLTKFLTPIAA